MKSRNGPMTDGKPSEWKLIFATVGVGVAVFALDRSIELGVAGGVPYVAVVCLAYVTGQRRNIWIAALCCSLLTMLGYFLSPSGGEEWKVIFNRALAVFAIGVTAVFADIAKRAHDRVKQVNESLEERVKERTLQLEKANTELTEANHLLETSNQELEQVAFVASHDLQEPLRKISAYGQLLQEECGEDLNEDGREYLGVVIDGAERLKELVTDLLAFSRITSRGKELAPTATNACLEEALSNLQIAIDESNARITHDELPDVVADDKQLTMLFQNLIGNALKYCEETPQIHIGSRNVENDLEVSIKDNGIGIEPQYFEQVFEIFKRLHRRQKYTGTGIGLANCRKIVERLGGRIWVESQPGQGSTFFFTAKRSQ